MNSPILNRLLGIGSRLSCEGRLIAQAKMLNVDLSKWKDSWRVMENPGKGPLMGSFWNVSECFLQKLLKATYNIHIIYGLSIHLSIEPTKHVRMLPTWYCAHLPEIRSGRWQRQRHFLPSAHKAVFVWNTIAPALCGKGLNVVSFKSILLGSWRFHMIQPSLTQCQSGRGFFLVQKSSKILEHQAFIGLPLTCITNDFDPLWSFL